MSEPIARLVPAKPEPLAHRIIRLQAEARSLGAQHVEAFLADLATLIRAADDIAEGGEAYPVGVRQHARQVGAELCARRYSIKCLMERQR